MSGRDHLILIGAPGAGKGTQADRLVEKHGFKHISTGNLLRAEISKGSELGNSVKELLAQGKLVSDDIVADLILANVDLENEAYIFDGFPRTRHQAEILEEKILKGRKVKAIYFNVQTDQLVDRLTNRRTCGECGEIFNLITKPLNSDGTCTQCHSDNIVQRKDDTEEVIRDRMQVFSKEISPILEYYKGKGCLKEIDGSLGMEEIYKEVVQEI